VIQSVKETVGGMLGDLKTLLAEIEATLGEGTLGVAATFLPTGESVHYRAEEVFPTASVIKIAIVTELFAQAAEGRIDLNRSVEITEDNSIGGSGVLGRLSPGVSLSLADLAFLTIAISDNTASNLCLAAVGGPVIVNARMHEWGMPQTIIHRPIKFHLTPDDPPHTATGTPKDMTTLLIHLAQGTAYSPAVSAQTRNLMGQVREGDLLSRYLDLNPYSADLQSNTPPWRVESKPGAVTGVRNDAALISRGDETLAVTVYTKGSSDPRWVVSNRGNEAVGQVGRLLTEQFFGSIEM